MMLQVIVDEKTIPIEVDPTILSEAEEFFTKIDRDMDKGWQMGRSFVEKLSSEDRCRIVADKLLGALESNKTDFIPLFSAYILHRLPSINTVEIDQTGEMQNTQFSKQAIAASAPQTADIDSEPNLLSPAQAAQLARDEVKLVTETSGGYQFEWWDRTAQAWQKSPLFDLRETAEEQRMITFRERFQALIGSAG